jgi:allantoate deiminase
MNTQTSLDKAHEAVERCLLLAGLSEEEDRTTRTFLAPPMREAHALLRRWMGNAGLTVSIDPIGNVHGLLPGLEPDSPRLVVGSHLDTVPGAGAFDGVLGVMLAIGLAEALNDQRPEFGIEIVGFSEEEGVRFGVPFLGSRAFTGTLDPAVLDRQDARGITMAQAIRDFGLDPARLAGAEFHGNPLGYVEFHIEQGPVLDQLNIPLGVVNAIAGQTRLEVVFTGETNHAGTTPMHLRRDAMPGVAEWIVQVEREASVNPGLVATVGSLAITPGASNVIPGEARATLDVRSADDNTRTSAVRHILDSAQEIAARRRLEVSWQTRLEQNAVGCDNQLADAIARAVEIAGYPVHRMVSGAGHDAMVMASRMPMAMLFLRSPGGISHHSAESVRIEDVAASLRVGWHFLKQVRLHHA